MQIQKHDFERMENIQKEYGSMAIIPFDGVKFTGVWATNYKDKVKIGVLYEMDRCLEYYGDKSYPDSGNIYAEMTEKQALELFNDLKKTLTRRGCFKKPKQGK